MTKEELIKLSRENLRKSKQGSLCECYDEAFIKGYELSEKRIAELEKKLTEKVTLESLDVVSGKVTELKAQIEKMKNCGNCTKGNCVNIGQKGKACAYWISNVLRR